MVERMTTNIQVYKMGMVIEHGVTGSKLFAQADNWDCYISGNVNANRYDSLLYMVCLAAKELDIRQMSVKVVKK